MSEHKSLKGKLQQDINDTWNENGILTDYTFFMEKDLRDAVAGLLEELEKSFANSKEESKKDISDDMNAWWRGYRVGLGKGAKATKKWLPDAVSG